MSTELATCKVDADVKMAAAKFLWAQGITLSEYLRLAIIHAAANHTVPFDVFDTGVRPGRKRGWRKGRDVEEAIEREAA